MALNLDDVNSSRTIRDDHIVFHVRHAWTSLHTSSFKMPWENGLQSMQLQDIYNSAKRLKVSGNLGPAGHLANDRDDIKEVTKNSFADANIKLLKSTDDKLWEQKLSMERKAAYKKWSSLVTQNVMAWSISRPRGEQDIIHLIREGIAESIKDCLGVKATCALHARAGPLIRYTQFAKEQGFEPFPISESVAYSFLKRGNFAATFPKSFITSVAFAKYVVGLLDADEVLSSARIKGFASIHFAGKRKLIQRPPLTVVQIMHLENIMQSSGRTGYDKVAAGFFLFLIFGRLRYSDAQSVTVMELEIPMGEKHGFLECATSRSKTSTSLEKRTRLLPVVVPTQSFTEDGWVLQWLEERERAGLKVGSNLPLLPNPAQGGGWTRVPMTCEAGGDWLRSLLKDAPAAPNQGRLGTHSCKCSLLSMASKFGMNPTARRFLGYHSLGRDRSMLTYSRDSMSWPMRLLLEMISDINNKEFSPDQGRSGMFRRADRNAPVESKDTHSTSSSCDSQDEEEWQHSEEEKAVEQVAGPWRTDECSNQMVYFRHPVSRCIHATADEAGSNFKCGRNISQAYLRCKDKPAFMHPVCSGCFR